MSGEHLAGWGLKEGPRKLVPVAGDGGLSTGLGRRCGRGELPPASSWVFTLAPVLKLPDKIQGTQLSLNFKCKSQSTPQILPEVDLKSDSVSTCNSINQGSCVVVFFLNLALLPGASCLDW